MKMKKTEDMAVQKLTAHLLQWSMIAILAAFPLLATAQTNHGHGTASKLVQKVRENTQQFIDVNNATAAGYQPFLGCVSGPDHGAMGIHYVKGELVGDGKLDDTAPEALIYEPVNGGLRLVGVEFIVDAATWLSNNNGVPPSLDGQTFQLIGVPNRFGIPAPFFELHVWAWRDNPNGAYVDWNNQVSCEHQ
jgi:hypothetical protein